MMLDLLIFVFAFWLYGGLNHKTFLFLFLQAFLALLLLKGIDEKCPLSFSAVSKADLTLSNSSLLQDESEILLLIILGNYLMIVGGWFEKSLI